MSILLVFIFWKLYVLPWGGMSFWGIEICPTYLCLPFISSKTKSLNRIGPHNIDVLSLIFGSMLGDSTAEKHGNGTRIILQQESNNVEYLMWFHKYLSTRGYCSLNKPKLLTRTDKKGKVRFYYKIRTWTFTNFNWIYDIFYPINGIKVVPKNINQFLSPLALAVWIQDDGTSLPSGLKIATNSFTKEEVLFLCEILYKNFNLIAKPNKDGDQWVIYIHSTSMPTLVNIVKPYMVLSMYRKLGKYII